MFTCPKCKRVFAKANRYHSCNQATIDDIFAKSSDEVLLSFDRLLEATASLEPNFIGPAKRAVVFTKEKAWLIARPARKWLDVTVFFKVSRPLAFVHRITPHYSSKKMEHKIRLHTEDQLTPDVVEFLREAHQLGA